MAVVEVPAVESLQNFRSFLFKWWPFMMHVAGRGMFYVRRGEKVFGYVCETVSRM